MHIARLVIDPLLPGCQVAAAVAFMCGYVIPSSANHGYPGVTCPQLQWQGEESSSSWRKEVGTYVLHPESHFAAKELRKVPPGSSTADAQEVALKTGISLLDRLLLVQGDQPYAQQILLET